MATPQRILIVRPSALGDIVRSVPVLTSLRRAFPDAQIDWLVRDTYAQSISAHPALSRTVSFPRVDMGKELKRGRTKALRSFVKTLRRAKYDTVLDCQGLFRTGFFSFASGARTRIGYKDASEMSWLFHTMKVDAPVTLHTVDRALELAQAAGADISAPDLSLHAPADARSQAIIEYPDRYAVLAPTSAWNTKCWPIDRFAELAKHLADHTSLDRVIVVGGPGERLHCAPLLELAERHPKITDRVGSTSIGMLMALIERAKIVVANDSAPLHIGVGFKRPLVALLGPTDPKRACPYGREHDVLQHFEDGDQFYFRDSRSDEMIKRITLDEVIDACETRLS